MDITSEQLGPRTIVRLAGRLDGRWADHLSRELDSRLRLGQHHITLDMAATVFLSSVGIRVLMSFHKKFKALDGSFAIQNPSPQVGDILQLAGLLKFFTPAPSASDDASRPANAGRNHASATTRFEVFDLEGGGMVCRTLGDPARLDGCRFTADDCQRLSLNSWRWAARPCVCRAIARPNATFWWPKAATYPRSSRCTAWRAMGSSAIWCASSASTRNSPLG
jgi:anti-anti-sigma factor